LVTQGVVTLITQYLEPRLGMWPLYSRNRCGLPYFPVFHKKVTQSLGHQQFSRMATWSQFSSVVTRSRTVVGRSQIVIPVAALSTAHIGMTAPCYTNHILPCLLQLLCWLI